MSTVLPYASVSGNRNQPPTAAPSLRLTAEGARGEQLHRGFQMVDAQNTVDIPPGKIMYV